MTRPLTQAAFGALVRRHFGFLVDEDPVVDRRRGSFFATYALPSRTVTVECDEDRDYLAVRVAEAEEQALTLAARHTGRPWTADRLERAFAEDAADLRARLGGSR